MGVVVRRADPHHVVLQKLNLLGFGLLADYIPGLRAPRQILQQQLNPT